jgi:hypothetical protein
VGRIKDRIGSELCGLYALGGALLLMGLLALTARSAHENTPAREV